MKDEDPLFGPYRSERFVDGQSHGANFVLKRIDIKSNKQMELFAWLRANGFAGEATIRELCVFIEDRISTGKDLPPEELLEIEARARFATTLDDPPAIPPIA